MLSERLKSKELFVTDTDDKFRARSLLDDAVRKLVMVMVAVERDDIYTRKEIEEYVLKRMGCIETLLYGMDDEEFNLYLDEQLIKEIRRGLK